MTGPDDGVNVLVRFDHVIVERPISYGLAITIEDIKPTWIPKSEVGAIDTDTGELWIPMWLAEKKGLSYE